MTQEEILALMKSDSDKGMEAVTKQYTALVYKIVLNKLSSLCSQEDIEEIVSDVFVELYRKYETIDFSKGSLTAFIMLLAQRRSVDAFRKAVKNKNAYTVLSEDISDTDTIFTEDIIMKTEERNLLFDSIYSKYYDEEYHKHYTETFVLDDTDAIYNIVNNFTNFEGTVQVFDK